MNRIKTNKSSNKSILFFSNELRMNRKKKSKQHHKKSKQYHNSGSVIG